MFRLHPRLAADSVPLGELALCRLRLMNDRRYPWLLLVPRRPDVVELHHLDSGDRALLVEEIAAASLALAHTVRHDKINVATLGNIVRQLHVHVVARRVGDAAWPGPVWGQGAPEPYEAAERDRLIDSLRGALGQG